MLHRKPFDWSDYVGLPWLELGREESGCDCYGLFRLAFTAGTGIALPSFDGRYVDTADHEAINGLIDTGRSAFRPVAARQVRPFDAVLMHADPWHVGLVVRRGLMLHMPEGRTSVIEPFTCGRFGRRVEGTYRHEALA